MRWIALLVLVLLAGCAGAPVPESAEEADPTGVLRGLVVDAALRPLADVNVSVAQAGQDAALAQTGVDGLFRFEGLAPGTYVVEARKATYLSAQTLANVQADVPEPDLVQLVLAVQEDEVPFVVAIAWEGYIGCAFTYGNLCSAPAQLGYDILGDSSAHLFWSEYVDVGRVPDLVQAEAVWHATLPTSEELKPIFGWSEPVAWQQLQYGGTFFSESVRSPSFHRLDAELLAEPQVGVTAGLVVEFYSGGDVSSPTGLTLNQPVRLFLHNFYGYLPPEAWRFATDGAPPGP
jgi:hypothetical protein